MIENSDNLICIFSWRIYNFKIPEQHSWKDECLNRNINLNIFPFKQLTDQVLLPLLFYSRCVTESVFPRWLDLFRNFLFDDLCKNNTSLSSDRQTICWQDFYEDQFHVISIFDLSYTGKPFQRFLSLKPPPWSHSVTHLTLDPYFQHLTKFLNVSYSSCHLISHEYLTAPPPI